MILADSSKSIRPYVPEKIVPVAPLSPKFESKLMLHLPQAPLSIPASGLLGGAGLGQAGFMQTGLIFGTPIKITPQTDFLPLVSQLSQLVTPEMKLSAVDDMTSAAARVAGASSIVAGTVSAFEFLDAIPQLPKEAEIAVHVFGLLRMAGRAFKTTFRDKDDVVPTQAEKALLAAGVAAAVITLVADCPGLEPFKVVTDRLAVVVKIGETVYLMAHPAVPLAPMAAGIALA